MVAALASDWKRQREAERREHLASGEARGMAAGSGCRAAGITLESGYRVEPTNLEQPYGGLAIFRPP